MDFIFFANWRSPIGKILPERNRIDCIGIDIGILNAFNSKVIRIALKLWEVCFELYLLK